MPMTALDLPMEALKEYRPMEAIRRSKHAAGEELGRRRRRARRTARKAAELLRDEFGASEVVVFGSLAKPGHFTPWSDIDLAARGIPPDRFFSAVAMVTGMSAEFKIDLVDLDTSPPHFREAIEKDGKRL